MSSPLLLNGHAEFRDETPALRREIERLVSELRRTEGELKQAQNEARLQTAAIASLRRQLSPLYRALQGVFGELEQFDVAIDEMAVKERAVGSSKWDAIKARYQGRIAEAIDVLLLHGTMNSSQLAAAMKMDRSNLSKNLLPKLSSMGLIARNGRDISLKER